jgi:hypothetical protein
LAAYKTTENGSRISAHLVSRARRICYECDISRGILTLQHSLRHGGIRGAIGIFGVHLGTKFHCSFLVLWPLSHGQGQRLSTTADCSTLTKG